MRSGPEMDDRVFDLLVQSISDLKLEIRNLNDRLLSIDRAFSDRLFNVEKKVTWYAGGISVFAVSLTYILPLVLGKIIQ